MKHQIESLASGLTNARKHTIVYTSPSQNPFKTLPKDAPTRGNKDDRPQRSGSQGSYNSSGGVQQNNYGMNNGGGYRGGRGGGYGNRAGGFNNAGYNNNRNFSGQMGGYNNGGMRGGGYQNNNMGMNNFGGGYNQSAGMMGNNMRGGMGGMRGGRGAMGGGMMPMGGMGMGMGGMGMNPMLAGMGMQGTFSEGPKCYSDGFANDCVQELEASREVLHISTLRSLQVQIKGQEAMARGTLMGRREPDRNEHGFRYATASPRVLLHAFLQDFLMTILYHWAGTRRQAFLARRAGTLTPSRPPALALHGKYWRGVKCMRDTHRLVALQDVSECLDHVRTISSQHGTAEEATIVTLAVMPQLHFILH